MAGCEGLESRNLDRMKRTRQPRIEHGSNTDFRVPSAFHPWLPPAIGTESTRRREYLGRFKVRSRFIQGSFKVHSRSVQGSCGPRKRPKRGKINGRRAKKIFRSRTPRYAPTALTPGPSPAGRGGNGGRLSRCPCRPVAYCTSPSTGGRCSGPPPQPLKPLVSTTYITCQHIAPDSKSRGTVQQARNADAKPRQTATHRDRDKNTNYH